LKRVFAEENTKNLKIKLL